MDAWMIIIMLIAILINLFVSYVLAVFVASVFKWSPAVKWLLLILFFFFPFIGYIMMFVAMVVLLKRANKL